MLVFFPDPWHKKRHHKRRLIDAQFVGTVAAKLRRGGVLRLATDWQDYAEQMLAVCNANPASEISEPGPQVRGAAGLPAADALRAARRAPRPRRVGSGVQQALVATLAAAGARRSSGSSGKWKLPRIPSTMNCTASAARITPERRLMTLAPVTPRTCISRGVASINTQQTTSTSDDTARKPSELQRFSPYFAGGQQDGGQRARPCDEGKRERKYRNVLALLGLLLLGRGRAWCPRCARTPCPAQSGTAAFRPRCGTNSTKSP